MYKQLVKVLVCVSLLWSSLGHAVDVEKATKHAEKYVAAFKNSDWERVSELHHPSVLKQLRKRITAALEAESSKGRRAVRTYVFGYLPSMKPVYGMTDQQFFVTFFRSMVGRHYAGKLKLESIELLGRVEEGDTLVHFVTRLKATAGERKIEAVSAESLMDSEDGYGMLLNTQLQRAIDHIVQLISK